MATLATISGRCSSAAISSSASRTEVKY
jgi:hypothetical protein